MNWKQWLVLILGLAAVVVIVLYPPNPHGELRPLAIYLDPRCTWQVNFLPRMMFYLTLIGMMTITGAYLLRNRSQAYRGFLRENWWWLLGAIAVGLLPLIPAIKQLSWLVFSTNHYSSYEVATLLSTKRLLLYVASGSVTIGLMLVLFTKSGWLDLLQRMTIGAEVVAILFITLFANFTYRDNYLHDVFYSDIHFINLLLMLAPFPVLIITRKTTLVQKAICVPAFLYSRISL